MKTKTKWGVQKAIWIDGALAMALDFFATQHQCSQMSVIRIALLEFVEKNLQPLNPSLFSTEKKRDAIREVAQRYAELETYDPFFLAVTGRSSQQIYEDIFCLIVEMRENELKSLREIRRRKLEKKP